MPTALTVAKASSPQLAILYSERPREFRGGETGFLGRGQLVPEFAAVAFNLNDPKKVSKIVETEYGFHIIQLIEKRGDRINTRHILLRPKVAEKDLQDAVEWCAAHGLVFDYVNENTAEKYSKLRRYGHAENIRA